MTFAEFVTYAAVVLVATLCALAWLLKKLDGDEHRIRVREDRVEAV